MRFLSSCQYTHGCYAPASWAARHTTVCLDVGHTRMGKMLQDEHNRVVDIGGADGDDNFDDSQSDLLDAVDRLAGHFKVPLEKASPDT